MKKRGKDRVCLAACILALQPYGSTYHPEFLPGLLPPWTCVVEVLWGGLFSVVQRQQQQRMKPPYEWQNTLLTIESDAAVKYMFFLDVPTWLVWPIATSLVIITNRFNLLWKTSLMFQVSPATFALLSCICVLQTENSFVNKDGDYRQPDSGLIWNTIASLAFQNRDIGVLGWILVFVSRKQDGEKALTEKIQLGTHKYFWVAQVSKTSDI